MSGYPSLFPAGFVEYQDPCSGPKLYRNQPSRSSSGVTLNQFMNKYVTGEYKEGDFIRMATNLKQISRVWNKLPKHIKKEFVSLMKESNSEVSKELSNVNGDSHKKRMIENFGGGEPVEMVNKFIEEMKTVNPGYDEIKAIKSDNKMSIFIIVIVAIVAVVIGFLIACSGN